MCYGATDPIVIDRDRFIAASIMIAPLSHVGYGFEAMWQHRRCCRRLFTATPLDLGGGSHGNSL